MTATETRCTACSKVSSVQIYSAGFSDVVAFTCDRDSTVVTVSIYDKTLGSIFGTYPEHGWSETQVRAVEANLVACPCGGTFKHNAKPKCPNCGTILNVEKLARSEFVLVGLIIDGEKEPVWRPP